MVIGSSRIQYQKAISGGMQQSESYSYVENCSLLRIHCALLPLSPPYCPVVYSFAAASKGNFTPLHIYLMCRFCALRRREGLSDSVEGGEWIEESLWVKRSCFGRITRMTRCPSLPQQASFNFLSGLSVVSPRSPWGGISGGPL